MKCEKGRQTMLQRNTGRVIFLKNPKSHEQDLVARRDMQHFSIFYYVSSVLKMKYTLNWQGLDLSNNCLCLVWLSQNGIP